MVEFIFLGEAESLFFTRDISVGSESFVDWPANELQATIGFPGGSAVTGFRFSRILSFSDLNSRYYWMIYTVPFFSWTPMPRWRPGGVGGSMLSETRKSCFTILTKALLAARLMNIALWSCMS